MIYTVEFANTKNIDVVKCLILLLEMYSAIFEFAEVAIITMKTTVNGILLKQRGAIITIKRPLMTFYLNKEEPLSQKKRP